MLMLFSISQHSLHGVKLGFWDHRTPAASLFPLFDSDGRTRALLFTNEHHGRITLLDFKHHLLSRRSLLPRLWPHRVELRHSSLSNCTEAEACNLAHLWHFDPWWELAADRYLHHPAVPALKSTNLPGFDETITRIWFNKTLSHVTWIGYGEGESMTMKRFQPKLLATATRNRGPRSAVGGTPATRSGEWRLQPFWHGR